MARETTAQRLPDGAATATAEAPVKPASRRATATTPTAPLGRPVVEPVIEQIDEGGDTAQEVASPQERDLVDDREWLTGQLRHLIGCPIERTPFHSGDGEPSRSTRIDVTDAREPYQGDGRAPKRYRVVQCNECGARARVRLPRTEDDY